ncbi:unnamed protein product [Phaeothamnion confervicola]
MTHLLTLAETMTAVNVLHGVVRRTTYAIPNLSPRLGQAPRAKIPLSRKADCNQTPYSLARELQATFSFFHWIKGSPDEFSQGEWNGLTFWEQLDAGLPWTPTKKFLMLVPAILCLIPSVLTDYDPWYLAVNVPVFVVLVVGKLPIMHRVRIMSINTTAGVDDRGAFCGAFSAPAAAVGVGKAGAALGRSKAD